MGLFIHRNVEISMRMWLGVFEMLREERQYSVGPARLKETEKPMGLTVHSNLDVRRVGGVQKLSLDIAYNANNCITELD